MNLAKPKRISNPFLLKWIRDNCRCIVCGDQPVDPHHIKTKGSGGDDAPSNIMPLCREHHCDWDAPWKGPGWMIRNHPDVRMWLLATGNERIIEKCEDCEDLVL